MSHGITFDGKPEFPMVGRKREEMQGTVTMEALKTFLGEEGRLLEYGTAFTTKKRYADQYVRLNLAVVVGETETTTIEVNDEPLEDQP